MVAVYRDYKHSHVRCAFARADRQVHCYDFGPARRSLEPSKLMALGAMETSHPTPQSPRLGECTVLTSATPKLICRSLCHPTASF